MKFQWPLACLSLIAILLFTECRKGENDPLISLRSRKTRVAGSWKLKSGFQKTEKNSPSGRSTSDYAYNTNVYSYSSSGGYSVSEKYELTMEFRKNGSVTITEVLGQYTYVTNGQWDFMAGVGKAKTKEDIVINTSLVQCFYSSYGVTTAVSSFSYRGTCTYKTFKIKELRNKKMVLTYEYFLQREDISETTEAELIMEQK
jgi:hypothetical protein